MATIKFYKKHIFLLLLIFFTTLGIQAQKLTGTVIGDFEAFDYGPYACSSTVNTPANVFDGKLETFYAACNRDNGWVGLDLGEPHVITEIAYCPRVDLPGRLELGVFEGANNPDFGDAVPIFLITEIPSPGKLTKKSISVSKAFRYVRYKGPMDARCNIAEIEFYGIKSAGDNSKLFQATNLPAVIIHTVNEEDILSKEIYVKGIFTLVSEDGTNVYTDSTEIRGRGNASWEFPKKPYRVKLYNKASLLGFPAKEKSWTLINNYGDKTLMRNLLAFDLSKKLELTYTPAGKPVDVFLNGQYKGTYQLCDQVEVATNRVQVDKMAKTTVSLPDLSGGYFLEIDAYADREISWFTSYNYRIPVTIKYPKDDEINDAQRNYIVNHFKTLEDALLLSTYTNPTTGYRKYMDIETFLRHFLVGEISGNTDTYWSTYMYKLKSNDKFYFGPVWDFDLAYDNDNRTYPINNLTDWIYNTKGSSANGAKNMVNRIFSDPQTLVDLKRIYSNYRDKKIISEESLLAVVDDYQNQLYQSQQLNFTRWRIMNTWVHMNPIIWGSYDAEVENVRNYIRNRILWVDKKLSYVPSAVHAVTNPNIACWSKDGAIHITGFSNDSQIQVYDISGRLQSSQISSNDANISIQKGIYVLKVTENNNQTSIIKVVVE